MSCSTVPPSTAIAKFMIVALAIALCVPTWAQGKGGGAKRLDSFCGYKMGENKEKLEKTVKMDPQNSMVLAKKPFRKFKHVSLEFSDDEALSGVTATLVLPKAKLEVAKKELNECCKILAKFDGMEGLMAAGWQESNDNHCQKEYAANCVTIYLEADAGSRELPNGKMEKFVRLTIGVFWNLTIMQRQPIFVKSCDFAPDKGISRREFVEKAFRVKFGEEIGNSIKLDAEDDKSFFTPIMRNFALPFFGCNKALFFASSSGKLQAILLLPPNTATKKSADLSARQARLKKVCDGLGKWLGSASFGEAKGGEKRIASRLEDDGIIVEAACESIKKPDDAKKNVYITGCSLVIMPAPEAGKAGMEYCSFQIPSQTLDKLRGANNDIKDWLDTIGVVWPEGSSVLYLTTIETLIVRNTKENIDKIESKLTPND